MTKEQPQHKIEEADKQQSHKEWADKIVQKYNIEQDAEHFIVKIINKEGKETAHYISKHSGSIGDKMEVKELGLVPREEIIEAIQKMYPAMEEPNLKEALLRLKKTKEKQ